MKYPLVDRRQWEIVPFRKHPLHDSIWALVRGADGHIYIGLCCEYSGGGVAQLYRYNVASKKLEHCLDIGEVTGEPASNGRATQGKIHFSLCAASDGSIYGSTHCTTPPLGHTVWNPFGMWDDPLLSYPGGHIFRYDPKSGKAVDFGIIAPHEGLPLMVLDEKRQRLYGITYPKAHFFHTNLAGRDQVDYGRVSSWYPIGLCFDSRMNIFFSDTNSQLIKYDVKQDRLIFTHQTPYANPWNASRRFSWMSNLNLAEDGKIYGTHYHNVHLFRFDPREDTPRIEDLGEAADPGTCRMLRCLVPDGHGRIYYIACTLPSGKRPGPYLWCCYHIETGEKEVLGQLRIRGVTPSSWIGVTDLDGNVYIKGNGRPMTLAIYHPNA